MLGWEYPPHLTGGLGTACRGLAEALAGAGTEVLFVVPHEFGDEPRSGVQLLGCNRIAESSAALLWPPTREPAGTLERIALNSPLRPYESSRVFSERTGRARLRSRPAHSGREIRARGELGSAPTAERSSVCSTDEPAVSTTAPRESTLFDEVERYAARVTQLALSTDFDVVHAHDWMTWPAGLAVAEATGKPLICHVHACEPDRAGPLGDARIEAIEARALGAAQRVVCVSHYTAAELRRHYGVDDQKLRVVHNALGRRVARQRASLTRAARAPEQPLILFLGRVTSQKGPERFLEAAARVAATLPRARFVLGGDGDLLPAMIERAAELGLGQRVRFTGFLDELEVTRLFAEASVYVMPSVSEPFGIAPLEALAQDVPVIVPRRSGVAEVLKHALKVDPGDVEELAAAILSLCLQPALARELVLGGRQELARLRWGRRARSLLDVYAELRPNETA